MSIIPASGVSPCDVHAEAGDTDVDAGRGSPGTARAAAVRPRDPTIREATAEDIDGIIAMAQHFIAQTAYGAHIPSDAEHLRTVTTQLLTLGIIFVAERDGALVGMLAGLAYPHYLTGRQTASETAWWVEPQFRGARIAKDLLAAFEQWALEQGAARVEVGSWNAPLDRLYERLGYLPAERVFYKELST